MEVPVGLPPPLDRLDLGCFFGCTRGAGATGASSSTSTTATPPFFAALRAAFSTGFGAGGGDQRQRAAAVATVRQAPYRQLQRGTAPWRSVVIVDDAPLDQYLAPEFELFRQLFSQYGVHAAIADPSELVWQNGRLLHQGVQRGCAGARSPVHHMQDGAEVFGIERRHVGQTPGRGRHPMQAI